MIDKQYRMADVFELPVDGGVIELYNADSKPSTTYATREEYAAQAINSHDEMQDRIAELEKINSQLQQEAEIHAQEARTQKSTVHGIYQLIGSQKGDWNGVEPVREHIDQQAKRIAALEGLLRINADLIRCGIGGNYGGKFYEEKLARNYYPVLDALKNTTPSTQANEWKACKIEIPEYGKPVLVRLANGMMRTARRYYGGDFDYEVQGMKGLQQPVSWMSLPPQPEQEAV